MRTKNKLSLNIIALVVILISLIGKIFGFAREILLANYFGTSGIVDVYLMSVTIPSIFFGFLPAIGIGFTPVYFGIENSEERNRFVSNILISSALFAFFCISLAIIFSKNIVMLCAPGFSPENQELTSKFLWITVWFVLLHTPVQILTAFLNCNEDYINSNVSNLFVSVTQAVFVILAAKYSVMLLPVGVVLPWVFQFIWLFLASRKKHLKICGFQKNDKHVKSLLIVSFPLFFSNILVDINGFVDKMLSSSLDEGKLSALNYSFTLRAVFVTATSTVITTIIYPRIAEGVKKKDDAKICEEVEKYFDFISFIIIPIMVLCIGFAIEIVSIVLMRGQFNLRSVEITTYPFVMYMFSLLVLIWRELIIKIMYSYNQTSKNLKYSFIEVGLNICFSLLLVKSLEHAGLALGTTLASVLVFPLYMRNICRTVKGFKIYPRIINVLKEALASAIMLFLSLTLYKAMEGYYTGGIMANIIILGSSGMVGILVYGLICYLLKINECNVIVMKLLRKKK